MFKIKWDKENKLSNKFLYMIILSWFICGLGLGIAIGVIT